MTITVGLETIIILSMILSYVMALYFLSLCRKMDDVLKCYETIHKQTADLTLKMWICIGWFGAVIGGFAVFVFVNN